MVLLSCNNQTCPSLSACHPSLPCLPSFLPPSLAYFLFLLPFVRSLLATPSSRRMKQGIYYELLIFHTSTVFCVYVLHIYYLANNHFDKPFLPSLPFLPSFLPSSLPFVPSSDSYTFIPTTKAGEVWEAVGCILSLTSVLAVSLQTAFLHDQGWLWAINYFTDAYFLLDM